MLDRKSTDFGLRREILHPLVAELRSYQTDDRDEDPEDNQSQTSLNVLDHFDFLSVVCFSEIIISLLMFQVNRFLHQYTAYTINPYIVRAARMTTASTRRSILVCFILISCWLFASVR